MHTLALDSVEMDDTDERLVQLIAFAFHRDIERRDQAADGAAGEAHETAGPAAAAVLDVDPAYLRDRTDLPKHGERPD